MSQTRRGFLGSFGALSATVIGSVYLTGCSPRQLFARELLSDLRVSTNRVTPNGQAVDSAADTSARIGFTVGARATVGAWLTGPGSQRWTVRDERALAPDDYEIAFIGVVAVPGSENRRVLPNGDYQLTISAKDGAGQAIEKSAKLTVAEADTIAPEIQNLTSSLAEFSPNGDGFEDDLTVSYSLTKQAKTTVYVTDADGNRSLVEAPTKKNAVLLSHLWDGTFGGKVLKDGKYIFHVEAEDLAGNFTTATLPLTISNSGTPRLEITEAKFAPIALAQGGKLTVRIRVKNNGDTQIRTEGPPPGTEYSTRQNFTTFRDPNNADKALYFEMPGRWRVGVQWTNAPQLYPIRWGLFKDDTQTLAPGEEATIDGTIVVDESTTHELTFWASIIQEGVGYPGGQVGLTRVKVSF